MAAKPEGADEKIKDPNSSCSELICAGDKEENMIKEALAKRNSGPVKQLKSRTNQIVTNDKPLNAVILGRVTWPLLHKMALCYPEKATSTEQKHMQSLINSFSWLYPCSVCAIDFREKIVESPPRLSGREDLSIWLCE